MPRFANRWLLLAWVAASVACSTARNPSRGFRLAENGDTDRGKAAFVEFGCANCHDVRGANLPNPPAQPVVLGGPVVAQPSDGYLVTAIINPAYHAAHYAAPNAMQGGHPRMPDYTSRMTVQQLTDIVAYLQSRYSLSPVPLSGAYR
ncbi:MAG TPA: cytochrome c [Candidatus Acidoferrales bacterium]|nr:cytochrome c [Candidatus Acidoferrales bacterium]HXK04980.1 cytochrome c [Verrucomicrobiae bacterium]